MAQSDGSVNIDEFGDLQTPLDLATQICRIVADREAFPAAVVEPTCGVGNFFSLRPSGSFQRWLRPLALSLILVMSR